MPMPLPDPEQASWMTKAVAALAGLAATAFAAFRLVNRKDADVVKGHGESITKLFENAREDKAELHAKIDHLAETQRMDRDAILVAIREDKADMHSAISGMTQSLTNFQIRVTEGLGDRPTREELHAAGVLYQPPKG